MSPMKITQIILKVSKINFCHFIRNQIADQISQAATSKKVQYVIIELRMYIFEAQEILMNVWGASEQMSVFGVRIECLEHFRVNLLLTTKVDPWFGQPKKKKSENPEKKF